MKRTGTTMRGFTLDEGARGAVNTVVPADVAEDDELLEGLARRALEGGGSAVFPFEAAQLARGVLRLLAEKKSPAAGETVSPE